jgi:hypothetical protein
MNATKVTVVEEYNPATRSTSKSFLVDAEATQELDEWLARNRHLIPPQEEIGMVRPRFVVFLTVNGDLDAPTTVRIDVYHQIDSHGTIAIPLEEMEKLAEIVKKWGKPGLA